MISRNVRWLLASAVEPWRAPTRLWWELTYLVTGLIGGLLLWVPLVALAAASVGLLVVLPLAIPVVWLTFVVGRLGGQVNRSRCLVLLDVPLDDPVAPLAEPTWWRRFRARLRSRPRWYELVHALIWWPVTAVITGLLQSLWALGVAGLFLPLYAGSLPGGTAKFWLFEIGPCAGALTAAAAGLATLLAVAPWLTRLAVRLDLTVGDRLLGGGAGTLQARLAHLEASRTAAVDSAEAERRRIERDLHDGAQQRLVAMAVNLGAARQKLDEDPVAGRQLVDEAHEEAKAALVELRDLVRGIHPVILEDRGLDAALSAVVARVPVEVDLTVDVPERPPGPVETAAYYVVAEALTNVTRHAQASSVAVNLVRAGDRLVVEVRDDGVGGAEPGSGTGLAGLRSRVEALDGRLDLISPPGGPTTLLVDIPCEESR